MNESWHATIEMYVIIKLEGVNPWGGFSSKKYGLRGGNRYLASILQLKNSSSDRSLRIITGILNKSIQCILSVNIPVS